MRPSFRKRLGLALVVVAGALTGGCQGPAFYAKSAYADPVMAFEETIGEWHFRRKVVYSMEGSIGGLGGGAGGGCGCY